MSKRPFISLTPMNPAATANLNRMTFLMSISEITPQIFISGQMAATLEQVQRLGITYILNVAVESSAIVYPKHIKLEKFDITDFPTSPISNYFHTLTDKMYAHLNANKQNKVLVHCMAGISRSTTIVCAYLMRCMNMSLRDAYLLCKRHRPICFPNLGFWNQLISYEFQLKRENSVRMISTHFGYIPDVAYEEVKQIYDEQQPQPASLPFFAPSFVSNIRSPSINTPSNNNTLFLSSNQTRPIARDVSTNNSVGITRGRSLPSNVTNRSSAVAASTNVSNPTYQTPLFATNKQLFSSPTRSGPNRSSPPPGSSSYITNRGLPISTSPNIRHRTNPQPQPNVTNNLLNQSLTIRNNAQQRSDYETTYRASFIKPLLP